MNTMINHLLVAFGQATFDPIKWPLAFNQLIMHVEAVYKLAKFSLDMMIKYLGLPCGIDVCLI